MDDSIKRQDAISTIQKYNFDFPQYMERFVTELRDAMKADLEHDIRNLPSAQKTGKWMWVQYDANPEIGNWHCSICRFIPAAFNLAKKHLNYCPNCGASMRGEEE